MARVVLVCPVGECRRGKDERPYTGSLGDLAKHVAMSRDLAHLTWKKERGIPECPLPNEPEWRTKAQKTIRHVWVELVRSIASR